MPNSRQLTNNDYRFKNCLINHLSSQGFTLVEILVAVAIVAALAVAIIPNYIRFNAQQVLNNDTSKLIQTLNQAHANAQSSVNCHNGQPSSFWSVSLTSSNLSLNCSYNSGNTSMFLNESNYNYSSNVSMTSPSCTIYFQKNDVFICPPSPPPTAGASTTTIILNSGLTKSSQSVNVDKGGATYEVSP